ncbi:MAG: hypothetical protein J6S14_16680 [Clostridia bacterium]|nr:hypothetical protein [Clostridia bacterium]
MSYWGGAWSSLKFSLGSSAESMIPNLSYRYLKGVDGNLTYKNNRAYKYVAVHVAKQMAAQIIEGEVHKLFPRYQRYLENKFRDTVLKQQDKNRFKLIEGSHTQSKDWGTIKTSEGKTIVAKDKYGNWIKESLILYYDSDTAVEVNDVSYIYTDDTGQLSTSGLKETYTTKTVCFIDLAPRVSTQSVKNIVLTPVQGRDYTRKELIAGGDLTFSISGEINSNQDGIYPENDVKKFIQIMQYGGVVKVNHFMFKQFNIEQVLIKDYSLPPSEYKNIQPYSFTCVAVEPDEDVIVTKDTIAILNEELTLSPMNKWYKFILNSKLAETVARGASSTISSFATTGLDALVKNI